MKQFRYFKILITLLAFSACQDDPLMIDVSDVEVPDFEIYRFERDLFEMKNENPEASIAMMDKKYGAFYEYFLSGIIIERDSSLFYNQQLFTSNEDMRDLYEYATKKYDDLSWLKNDLSNAFKHFKYYFPKEALPKVSTCMSGFNYALLKTDSILGISLDMYLGKEDKYYDLVPAHLLPMYKRRQMNKENMLPDFVRAWALTKFGEQADKREFLSEMIHQGKIVYFSEALLPQVHDTLLIRYTEEQLKWCLQNEKHMWAYFIEKDLLFSGDQKETMKFLNDGPFTAAFNKESPARVGEWFGWKIVRAFMKENPEVSLSDLMKEKDAQKILKLSKYKP